MLTQTQIGSAQTSELEDSRDRTESKLTRREPAEREPAEGRQVMEERPPSAGTLRLERVKCGKGRCRKCAEGRGHARSVPVSLLPP
jgi:hypothetical protein